MQNNSLTQYIELFDQNREAIESHSPAAMNRLRPDALSALHRLGRLPVKGDEGHSVISLDAMFAPDFGVNVNRVPFAVDVAASFRCDVPNLSTLLGVVVNDAFRPTSTLTANLPEGVTVMSLADAAATRPELVGPYLGRIAGNDSAATALNTLLMQDGVFIHVADGVRLEKTIQIVNIFNASAPMMAVRRVLVVAGRDSQVRLLFCDHTQNAGIDSLVSQVVEISAAEGATVDYYDLEATDSANSRLSQLYARQQRGSRLTVNGTTLSCGHTRNEYVIAVADRCDTELVGMVIADGDQVVDNASSVFHNADHSHSRQTFKYILSDSARGGFEGAIRVDADAAFTEAYQTNRNLLASEDARMHTAPQLEIYCDEVKCSHGAAPGQLDQNALFYMRSRGIPLDEARRMLMESFMSDIIDTIRLDGLQDRLRHLVERRLGGRRLDCGECNTCK